MDAFLETLEKIWDNSFVRALVYLIVAFLTAWVVSFVVKRLCRLMKLDKKMGSFGVDGGKHTTAVSFIGKLAFIIVFLLFMPAVLGQLGLDAVSQPITDLVGSFVGYLPNIIAAAILVFVGIFIGQILEQVISVLLSKTRIDNLTRKLNSSKEGISISVAIGKVVNALVVLIAVVQALSVLDIEAISVPATSVINAIFGAVPDIILAAIVVAVGIFVAGIAVKLLGNILEGVGFDGMVAKLVPGMKGRFSPTKLTTGILRIVIILFIIAEGVDILGLEVISGSMSVILAYLPMLIKALIIALLAFFGAGLLEGFILKSMPSAKPAAKIAKAAIYTLAGFMILSQLGFAITIVNYAFMITLGALAVAFAIAFGIGGKSFAEKILGKLNFGSASNSTSDSNNTPSDNEQRPDTKN